MTFKNVALSEIIAHWPSDNNDSEDYPIDFLLVQQNKKNYFKAL